MFYSKPPYSDLIFQDAAQQIRVIPREEQNYREYLGRNFLRARALVDCRSGASSLGIHQILVSFFVMVFIPYHMRIVWSHELIRFLIRWIWRRGPSCSYCSVHAFLPDLMITIPSISSFLYRYSVVLLSWKQQQQTWRYRCVRRYLSVPSPLYTGERDFSLSGAEQHDSTRCVGSAVLIRKLFIDI